MDDKKYILGVYGSLRKNFSNHRFLKDSKYLGSIQSEPIFTMYSMGPFPALTLGNNSIYFEIYEVDETILKSIYSLEGYSGIRDSKDNWYDTMDIETKWGKAEIFYMKDKEKFKNRPVVETGNW